MAMASTGRPSMAHNPRTGDPVFSDGHGAIYEAHAIRSALDAVEVFKAAKAQFIRDFVIARAGAVPDIGFEMTRTLKEADEAWAHMQKVAETLPGVHARPGA